MDKEDFDWELSVGLYNSSGLVYGHTQGRKSPRRELLENRIEIRQVVLQFEYASEAPGGLCKAQSARSYPLGVSDSVDLEWGLRLCISNHFPPR